MKSLLLIMVGFVSSFAMAEEAQSDANLTRSTLIPAMSFRLDLSQSGLNAAQLKAEYGVSCTYRSGIFWPETKSCGGKSVAAAVNSDGTLSLAALTSEGLTRSSLENLSIVVSVKNGDRPVMSFSARGKNEIKQVMANKETIRIYKVAGGKLDIRVNGQDIFNTDWVKVDGGALYASARAESKTQEGLRVIGLPLWFDVGGDNRHYTSEERQLKNLKGVVFQDTYLATTTSMDQKTLAIFVRYESKAGQGSTVFSTRKTIPLTADGVSRLGTLELQQEK
jgi:hypothetical protein